MIAGKILIRENEEFKTFKRKEYKGQDIYLSFPYNNFDNILVSNLYSNRGKEIDKILESCLEIIDTANQLNENNDIIEPWQYVEMVINENEYMLYYEMEKYTFEVVDDKEEWAESLCEDLDYISADLPWFIKENIDWEKVADVLFNDYYVCDLSDYTFLIWRK